MRSSDLEGGRQLRWLTASKRRCLNHLCDLTSANDKYRNGYIRRSPGSPAIDGSFPAVDGSEAGNTLKSQWNENREEAIAGIKKAWRKHQLQKYSSLGKCISKQFQAMPSDLQKSQCSAAPVKLPSRKGRVGIMELASLHGFVDSVRTVIYSTRGHVHVPAVLRAMHLEIPQSHV